MKITTKWKPIEELVCFQLGKGNVQKTISLLSHLLLLSFHQVLMDKVHLKDSALHFDGNKRSISVICS